MKEALNIQDPKALFTLLPYDKRVYNLGRFFKVSHEPYIFFLDHESVPFDNKTEYFSMSNAWWLSELSFLAYEEGKTVENILKSLGLEVSFFNSARWDGEAYVAYDDEKVFLVYRGTEPTNLQDMMTDIRLNKVKTDKEGGVHSGFKQHFDDLEKEFRIGSMLSALLSGKRKLYITGHSLGAALAVYAAYYYSEKVPVTRKEEYSLYTFGAPKVGDESFMRKFDEVKVYRVVHKNDIICRLPPFSKYHHIGELYYIDFEKQIECVDCLPEGYDLRTKDEVSKVNNSVLGGMIATGNKLFRKYASILLDHSPLYYSIRIKERAIAEIEKAKKVNPSTAMGMHQVLQKENKE